MKLFILGLIFIVISGVSIFGQKADLDATFERGISLANASNFVEALAEFQRAESLAAELSSKRRAQLHFNIGVCYFRLARNHEARARFETAVRLFPKYERAHYALGMAASLERDWQQAETAFLAALKLKKEDGETWFDLAFVYLATGDMVKAEVAFRHSVRFKTVDAATAYNNIGVLNAIFGYSEMARASFESAVRVSNGSYKPAAANLETIRHSREDTKTGCDSPGNE